MTELQPAASAPQSSPLPSVEEVARAIHGDDEMQGEAFSPWDRMPDANRGAYRSNAKAVLDLITSRASTWVPQQPQPFSLPSVVEVRNMLIAADPQNDGLDHVNDLSDKERAVYARAARKVLDLVASRASTWAPQQPQPIVLPSVEDVMQAIYCMDYEGVLDGPTGVHRNMAQAVLDLVANRVPVWVPVEPGIVIKAGTMYRVAYDAEITKAVERVAVSDFCASYGFCIDPRTVPADPVDDQVERVAKALHGADKPDHSWENEWGGTREIYRRLARVALEAAE